MEEKHRVRISTVRDLPERCWRLHPQWCLLARDAAECVVEHDLTGRFDRVFAADEHYIGSVLALRGFPEGEWVRRKSLTWTKWTNSEIGNFSEITRKRFAELVDSECPFARKFAVGTLGIVLLSRHYKSSSSY